MEKQMQVGMRRPLFVVGLPRTGTTAMMWALNAHPLIWVTPEWRVLHYLEQGLEWSGLMRAMRDREPWQFDGTLFVGDKSPWFRDVDSPDRYFKLLPDAKLIWMCRNPLEQVPSLMEHNPTVGLDEALALWRRDWDYRRSWSTDPRVKMVNLAAFRGEPRECLGRLCVWLDIAYHEGMDIHVRRATPRQHRLLKVLDELSLDQLRS